MFDSYVIFFTETLYLPSKKELLNRIRLGAQRPGWPNSQLPFENLLFYDAQTL